MEEQNQEVSNGAALEGEASAAPVQPSPIPTVEVVAEPSAADPKPQQTAPGFTQPTIEDQITALAERVAALEAKPASDEQVDQLRTQLHDAGIRLID